MYRTAIYIKILVFVLSRKISRYVINCLLLCMFIKVLVAWMISRLSCSFFPPQCSNASSKLNVLVNKLHDYLAQSTVEDNKHKAALRDVDGIDFICSIYECAKLSFCYQK